MAWPVDVVFARGRLIFLVVAALPVIAPRSRLATVTILTGVVGWLAATTA